MRLVRFWFDALAIGAAIAVRVVPLPAPWLEARYANGAYPVIDRVVRAVTGPLPFSLGDVLAVVAVVWLARYWVVTLRRRSRGRGRGHAAALAALRTFAVVCAVYVWFMAFWAYNYSRVSLADKIPVRNDRTDEDSVGAFGDRVIDRLSHFADAAHRETPSDTVVAHRLIPTFDATIRRLGDASTFAPPRIKPTIFQRMMQLSASSGFTDPWTHEVNLDASSFPFERPAIYAHEWAHVAGFADESEANFISVVACTTSRDPLLAYSGWVLVWFNLPANVHLTHRLSRTALRDIVAIRARYAKQVNPAIERVQRVAYDRYLKSNHVKAGYESYRLFIRWMTGAEFDRDGLPVVRSARPGGRHG